MQNEKFCCCGCQIRGACYIIACAKLLLLLNDGIITWYRLVLLDATWIKVHIALIVVEMLTCFILLVGLKWSKRVLVMLWVWSSVAILIGQVVLSVILVATSKASSRFLLWIALCTAADIYMILVVSSYGVLMGRKASERQRLDAWAEAGYGRDKCVSKDEEQTPVTGCSPKADRMSTLGISDADEGSHPTS